MALSDGGLGELLPGLLGRAVAEGELPPDTDVLMLTLAIASVFFGVPLVLGRRTDVPLTAVVRRQLALIWRGATQE